MNFLYPAMLGGLAALAIPIALHLIARHRFPVLKIPTIRFLRAERRANVFAWKVVDVPQLLLRLLLLLLLVLGMSRIFSPGLSSQPAPRNLLVIVDASASMRSEAKTESGRETLLERAKREADELLGTITPPSRCGVIIAGDSIDQVCALQPDADIAKAALAEVQACDGTGPGLVRAVAAACDLLHGRRETKSQVVVYTDLRATALAARNQEDIERIRTAQNALGRKLEIIFVNVGGERDGNQAIVEAGVRGSEVRVGDDAHVVARIVNYSDADVELTPRLAVGGRKEPPGRKRTIPAGEEIIVDLTARMNRAQRTQAEVQVQTDDALRHDNSFYLPLTVADSRRVLIINGAGGATGPQASSKLDAVTGVDDDVEAEAVDTVDGARILQYALNPGRELGLTYGTGILPTVITPAALAGQPLSKYDVIVLYDVSSLPDAAMADLETYVRQGRALVIFAAGKLSPMRFNRSLAAGSKNREALSPAQVGNDRALKAPVGLAETATTHPVLAAFRERRQGDLSVIRFVQLREIRRLGSDAAVMFRDAQGEALAVEKRIAQGRVVLCSFGLELTRGNLARTRVFLPMLWRLMDYLTGRLEQQKENALAALRPVVLDVSEPQFAFVDELELTPIPGQPQADALPTRTLPKRAGDTVLLEGLPAGRYTLHKPMPKDGSNMMVSYARQLAVNADPRESDVAPANPATLKEVFGERIRIRTPATPGDLVPTGAELVRLLAILLIVLYAVEAAVGWALSAKRERERTGGTTA